MAALALSRTFMRTSAISRAPFLTRGKTAKLEASAAAQYIADVHEAQDEYPELSQSDEYELQPSELIEEEGQDHQDVAAYSHKYIQDYRQRLYYMRLIEHDLPKFVGTRLQLLVAQFVLAQPLFCLVALRKPFKPPQSTTPLVVRSLYYGGEGHPVEKKRCITVAVDNLPLTSPQAVHRARLIAGTRWSPDPPKNSGISIKDDWGSGYIKVACEDFPEPAMNFKWASDRIDEIVAAANVSYSAFDPCLVTHASCRTRTTRCSTTYLWTLDM